MIRRLLQGAAKRSSSRHHVIQIRHERRRFGLHQKIRQPGLSRECLERKLDNVGHPRDGAIPKNRAARQAQSTLPGNEYAYDRATITKTMKLPALEEVPSALKSCYRDGVLSYPRHLRTHFWVQRHVKAENYSDGQSHPSLKFRHRLAFNAEEYPEVIALGKGDSKVRLLQKIYLELDINPGRIDIPGLIEINEPSRNEFEHQRDQTFAFDTVHNFCAKHGLVPVIKVFEERNPLNPRSDPTHFTLQVQLPEHQISVAVRASVEDRHLQEEVAFIHFNKELQESGLLQISELSQAMITSPSLSLTNAEGFVRFSRPGADISLAQKRRDRYKRVQIRLDGVASGTGCSVSTKHATQAAWLVTAVNIAKASPNLLGRFFDSPGAGLIAIASSPTAPIQPETVEDDFIKDDTIEDDPGAFCGIEYESIENDSAEDTATSENGPAASTSTGPLKSTWVRATET
ncbi:hypothetical protein OIDMADRAFT_32062 [Oidiodendron maius Zn]|uniref:Uncharacterized protein n=1 Tax=Oidiodendron maius (strain Zn) TaxID=913774 RepID=A0A0C3H4A3_OIDMZ|nr:hypothetical protein OIDMADRAFT_32062 [Oidiodendron maius Zn]